MDLYKSYIPCVLCVYQKQMFLKLQYWLIVTQYHSIPVAVSNWEDLRIIKIHTFSISTTVPLRTGQEIYGNYPFIKYHLRFSDILVRQHLKTRRRPHQ